MPSLSDVLAHIRKIDNQRTKRNEFIAKHAEMLARAALEGNQEAGTALFFALDNGTRHWLVDANAYVGEACRRAGARQHKAADEVRAAQFY